MHGALDSIIAFLAGLMGTLGGPAILAGIAWKMRGRIIGLLEQEVTAWLNRVIENTELAKRVERIEKALMD